VTSFNSNKTVNQESQVPCEGVLQQFHAVRRAVRAFGSWKCIRILGWGLCSTLCCGQIYCDEPVGFEKWI